MKGYFYWSGVVINVIWLGGVMLGALASLRAYILDVKEKRANKPKGDD